MIGMIVAMEKEIRSLSMENTKTEHVGGLTFTVGTLCGQSIVAAVCGIGKVFAAMCAQTMILRYSPDCIINIGVAGALSPKLHICDIAVGTAAVQYDMDTSPLGDPKGMISGIRLVELPCDSVLTESILAAAKEAGIPAYKGLIASADRFCATKQDKEAILQNFPAIACEMEGAAIAQVCYVNHVPFGLIRAISDGADGDAQLDYDTFCIKAAENAAHLMKRLLLRL